MKLNNLNSKVRIIKLLWIIHSILSLSITSSKIHTIYNELQEYGYWKNGNYFIISYKNGDK